MDERKRLVLAADDDPDLLTLVSVALRLEDYRVVPASDGVEAVQIVRDQMPALVILDVMMPGLDGYTVCQRIRQLSDVPVIMLTAKSDTTDIVRALDLGADDYVVKPFDVNELVARVKAVLHRTRLPADTPDNTLVSGDIVVHLTQPLVNIAGQETPLPPIEYQLLCLLVRNAGRVITRGHLLAQVWGTEYCGEDTHILEAAIARLRRRLTNGGVDRDYIVTRRGIGYSFNASCGSPV